MKKKDRLLPQLDLTCMLVPLFIVVAMCLLFIISPERSTLALDTIRGFLGNELGFFYSPSTVISNGAR